MTHRIFGDFVSVPFFVKSRDLELRDHVLGQIDQEGFPTIGSACGMGFIRRFGHFTNHNIDS